MQQAVLNDAEHETKTPETEKEAVDMEILQEVYPPASPKTPKAVQFTQDSWKAPSKDQPFNNLVKTESLELPARFKTDERANPRWRAQKLRAALKVENYMLASYCLLLICKGSPCPLSDNSEHHLAVLNSLAISLAGGLGRHLSKDTVWLTTMCWESFAFLSAGLPIALITLYDGLKRDGSDDDPRSTA